MGRKIKHQQANLYCLTGKGVKNAGCVIVFQEMVSSANKERPQFEAALEIHEEGDEIVFTKLDRGFRNQRQCINTLHDLQEKYIRKNNRWDD